MTNTNLSMKNVMNSIVSITRFNRGEANKIFEEVRKTGVKVVLKNNVRVGVLVDPEQYDNMVDILEEYSLLLEAERRVKNADAKDILSEKQVMENLNIAESDLDDTDVEIE